MIAPLPTETSNPVLRAHHLAYARATIPQSGREWVELTRRLAEALREHAELVLESLRPRADGADAVPIIDGLPLLVHLITLPGIYTHMELTAWIEWIVEVARRLRRQDWSSNDYNRPHRWPFEVLSHLVAFPAKVISQQNRDTALGLVSEAFAFFSAEPLASNLTESVAKVEHELRHHFGESGTHRTMIRRKAEALKQQGQFFANHGHGLGAASMYREANKVMQKHGASFEPDERSQLKRAEADELSTAVERGEFKMGGSVSFDMTAHDFTGSNAEATIGNLVDRSLDWLPDMDSIEAAVNDEAVEHPLLSVVATTTVDGEKVVGEAVTEAQRKALARVRFVAMHGKAVGILIHGTLINAVKIQGLEVAQVKKALDPLPLADGSVSVLLRGLERFLASDYISAVYILAPMVEESLRRVLRQAGFDTLKLRVLDQASGASRTDDAALGDLLRLEPVNGRSVADILGANLHQYISATMTNQVGPNLRNKTGHGQAKMGDCSPGHAGMLIHILVSLARREEMLTANIS
jgi:Domain of unknown function (DUF4209)